MIPEYRNTDVDPRTERHLIADQGEYVIDEVRKHWASLVGAMLEMLGGLILYGFAFVVPSQVWWLPVILGAVVVLHAFWRILERRFDRFVITNMRVFRMHGILSQQIATMPLARILDISVYKPFLGRICGYGHFVFESAAQAQGLREIRYVGHPDQRGLTIQRVIQQAGLRGYAGHQPQVGDDGSQTLPVRSPSWGDGEEPLPPIPPLPQNPPFDPDRTTTAPIDLPR
jgi:membrane protein YdbS with pleckstrin-like domain